MEAETRDREFDEFIFAGKPYRLDLRLPEEELVAALPALFTVMGFETTARAMGEAMIDRGLRVRRSRRLRQRAGEILLELRRNRGGSTTGGEGISMMRAAAEIDRWCRERRDESRERLDDLMAEFRACIAQVRSYEAFRSVLEAFDPVIVFADFIAPHDGPPDLPPFPEKKEGDGDDV